MHVRSCIESGLLSSALFLRHHSLAVRQSCKGPRDTAKVRRASTYWQGFCFPDSARAYTCFAALHEGLHRLEMASGEEGGWKGERKKINRESGRLSLPSGCPVSVVHPGEVGGSDDALHCIAFSSVHSYTHISIMSCLPPSRSILRSFANPGLLPFASSAAGLRAALSPPTLVYKPLLFFFFRPVPTPARLPHWGQYAALLSCIDWRRDGGVGHVRGGQRRGDLLVRGRG